MDDLVEPESACLNSFQFRVLLHCLGSTLPQRPLAEVNWSLGCGVHRLWGQHLWWLVDLE